MQNREILSLPTPRLQPNQLRNRPSPTMLRVDSAEILRGQKEVEIEHNGMLYRFRCTSLGKLILTK